MNVNSQQRVFFATDIHGSDLCFRKFLNAARAYNASALVLGGDITGKGIVPLVAQPSGKFRFEWLGETRSVDGLALENIEEQIRAAGMYPVRMTRDEAEKISKNTMALE